MKPHTIDIWSVFNQTKEKVLVTHRFRDALNELAIAAGAHPTWPILIEASSPWDNEIVSTFNTWTRYKGIVNPVILQVAIPNDKLRSPFESELADVMNMWASQGLIGHFVPFDRLAGLVAEGHCFDADGVIHIVKTAVDRTAKDKSCIQISSVR